MAQKGYLWIIVAAVILIGFSQGWFTNILGGGSTPASVIPVYPSDLETTVTINARDALATTDTTVTTDYYVFDKTGKFLKSGTTSSGTASFTVNYGQDYDVIAFYDSGTKYYPETVTFTADSGEGAQKTVNIGMMKVSNATIDKLRDPVDFDSNITKTLGSAVNFQLLYHVTTASAAINQPVIVIDANQTAITDVTLGGLSKVTCPSRLTVSAARQKFCFQDTTLKSVDSIRTLSGQVLFSASSATGVTDSISATVIDTQMYADPNYASKGKIAFKTGTQNANTNADVGATDNNIATALYDTLYFGG